MILPSITLSKPKPRGSSFVCIVPQVHFYILVILLIFICFNLALAFFIKVLFFECCRKSTAIISSSIFFSILYFLLGISTYSILFVFVIFSTSYSLFDPCRSSDLSCSSNFYLLQYVICCLKIFKKF